MQTKTQNRLRTLRAKPGDRWSRQAPVTAKPVSRSGMLRAATGLAVVFGTLAFLVAGASSHAPTPWQPVNPTASPSPNAPTAMRDGHHAKVVLEAPQQKRETDYAKPTYTTEATIFCPEGLLLDPILFDKVVMLPAKVFYRDSTMKELGCRDVPGGIHVRAEPTILGYVGVSVNGNPNSYFTWTFMLTNHSDGSSMNP